MPVLLNPRHEKFAQLLADGKSALDAYVAAGYKNTENARFSAHSLLSRKPEIKDRATQITTELAEKTAVDKEYLVKRARRLLDKAEDSGQLGAGVSALKEIGILVGVRVERSEVGAPGEFEAMSDAELEAAIIERFYRLFGDGKSNGSLPVALPQLDKDKENDD